MWLRSVGMVRWRRTTMCDESWDLEGSHWHNLVNQSRDLNFLSVFNIRANFTPRPTYGQFQVRDLESGEQQCSRLRPVENVGLDHNFSKARTQWVEVSSVLSSHSSI
jgi:hypothetical protein